MIAFKNIRQDIYQGVERYIARKSQVPPTRFYDPELFPWIKDMESGFGLIRRELDMILEHTQSLPNFQDISPEQAAITRDDRWKTFGFYAYGRRFKKNCALCPETDRLIRRIPGMTTALFSILLPGKKIPPHRGPYNGVLRYHLGLLVPKHADLCGIRVGNQERRWAEGESLVFDDTHPHSAWNNSSQPRAVLFVDFKRPLAFPASILNTAWIGYMAATPFVKTMAVRQKHWDKVLDFDMHRVPD